MCCSRAVTFTAISSSIGAARLSRVWLNAFQFSSDEMELILLKTIFDGCEKTEAQDDLGFGAAFSGSLGHPATPESLNYFAERRRAITRPAMPRPASTKVPGSGTAGGGTACRTS